VQADVLATGLDNPIGVAVDGSGDVFIADTYHNRVVEVEPDGTQLTIGSGLNKPTAVAVDGSGDVFIADTLNSQVVEVKPDGTQIPIGSGLAAPGGVAVDGSGDVFIGDFGHNRVVEVEPDGTQTTIVSGLNQPQGVAVDSQGDVFIADTGNKRILEVQPDGTQTTVVSGLTFAPGVAADAAGDVFIANGFSNQVLEVSADGTQTTFGSGLFTPEGVAVDAAGDVFIGDTNHNRVVKVTAGLPVTVSQATPTLSLTDASGTYNGNPFSASVTEVGVDGTTAVAGSFSYAYFVDHGNLETGLGATAPTNAGTYTVVATFTSSDPNYSNRSAQTTFTINSAPPMVSVTDASAAYNGNPFSASVTEVGVDGTTAVPGSFSYAYYVGSGTSGTNLGATAPTNAGTYTVVVSFTSSDPNYANGSAQTTFTISPRAVTLTGTRTYDGTATAAANILSITDLVQGDNLTLSGSATLPAANAPLETITSFAGLTLGGSSAGNYTLTGASGSVTITPAALTLSITDLGGTYNGNPFSASATAVGLDGKTAVAGSFSYAYYIDSGNSGSSLGATAPTNAGTYTVIATFTSSNSNYTGGSVLTFFTISPRAVTLTGTRTYDGTATAAANILSITNLVQGDSLTLSGSVTLAAADAQAEPITSFAGLTLGGSSAANYTLTGVSGSVTITPATPTLSVSDGGAYTGNPFPASATAVGLDGKTAVSGSFSCTYYVDSGNLGTSQGATAPSNPGNYTVLATFTSSNSNYTGGSALSNFSINSAPPMVSVTDAGGTYNGNPFPASATAVGLDGKTAVPGSFSYAYHVGNGTSGTSLGATAPTNAGTYTVVASFTSSTALYANGSGQTTFTIAQRPITVTANPQTKAVGSADPPLTYQVSAGNLVGSDAFSGSLSRAPGETAGSYPILQGTLADPNYALSFVGSVLYITSSAASLTGGQSMAVSSGGSPVTAAAPGASPGTPQLTATASGFDGLLTAVQFASAPLAGYSGTGTFFAVNAASTDLGAGSAVQLVLHNLTPLTPLLWYNGTTWAPVQGTAGNTVVADASGTALVSLSVGTSPSLASLSGTYFLGGTWTVSSAQAPTTVSFTSRGVTNAGGTYKGSAFTAVASVTSNGAGVAGANLSYAYYSGSVASDANQLASAPVNVGTYTVVATFAGNASYAGASASETFTIKKANVPDTIPNDSQTYGTPANLTLLPGTIGTGINGQNLDISYSSTGDTATANVGTYAITGTPANGTGLLSNYNVTLTNGTLTVNKASVRYTISNDSQSYGTPANLAHDLGTTISTGINGQNLDISYSSPGDTATANVGSYPITGTLANGTGLLSNYNVALANGTLTVTKANQTITFAALTPITFAPNETVKLSATASSGVAVVYRIDPSSSGGGTISGSTLTVTRAGTIVIDATQAGNGNYNPAPMVQRNLVVNMASQPFVSFSQLPTQEFEGLWGPAPAVQVLDQSGNPLSNVPVTLVVGGTVTGMVTSSSFSEDSIKGVATFSSASVINGVDPAGYYTLTATATINGVKYTTQTSIRVVAAGK